MVTRVSRGQSAIYQGGFQGGFAPQTGKGFLDLVKKGSVLAKKGSDLAKSTGALSKASQFAKQTGIDKKLDSRTGGLYSKGVNVAKSKGYGRDMTRKQKLTYIKKSGTPAQKKKAAAALKKYKSSH